MPDNVLSLAQDEYSGRKLGKYEILCRLSAGGMSEIFLAFQRGLAGFRKLVVLKKILPNIQGEEEFIRMFLNEARITAAFNHPNIAHVYDLDTDDGELFLAMEFIPGATLVEIAKVYYLEKAKIPVGFTLSAVRDAAVALHYAHTFQDAAGMEQQVIHRDVAEKNIMVTYDGTTKLLDFGIAKSAGHHQQTSIKVVKGSTGYMSPEQIRREPIDPRSDIFSLGIVLHECLTGVRLFAGATFEQELMAPLKHRPAPPSLKNPEVTAALDAVVLKALEKNKEDRFSTAREFARAIERVAGDLLWEPERMAAAVQQHFADRRAQTRTLFASTENGALTSQTLATYLKGRPPSGDSNPVMRADPFSPIPAPRKTSLIIAPAEDHTSAERPSARERSVPPPSVRPTPTRFPLYHDNEPSLPAAPDYSGRTAVAPFEETESTPTPDREVTQPYLDLPEKDVDPEDTHISSAPQNSSFWRRVSRWVSPKRE